MSTLSNKLPFLDPHPTVGIGPIALIALERLCFAPAKLPVRG